MEYRVVERSVLSHSVMLCDIVWWKYTDTNKQAVGTRSDTWSESNVLTERAFWD
jgi:hypothetical protein